ncbi:hypothetical protein VTK73DRAFT_5281 [Phialemonium thermophilum]|uniref:Enoyl reductase (ER) domain-containing protein n=1 Tax=Phialemonium thermophilum TaxID=223376 RepID=A0ABR3WP49_9PEZI
MAAAPTLAPSVPEKHQAVVITAPRAPLALAEYPTVPPAAGEVLVHVLWTSSTPLDLHQADGGLLIKPPAIMGGTYGGRIVQLGEGGDDGGRLHVGDLVFGFEWRRPSAMGHQTYLTTTDPYTVSKLPANVTLEQAVSVPCNLVTAFHTITKDFELPLPWPIPQTPPQQQDAPILVWGAASSVGNYVLQVLRLWGYRNLLAVAAGKHHDYLRTLGAAVCFDYRQGDVVAEVQKYVAEKIRPHAKQGPAIPYILDCIGSQEGTLRPITKIAEPGAKVAIMLPVIVRHASDEVAPEYEMDVSKVLPDEWRKGVELKGTRTFFYMQNEFFKKHLQREIIPTLLEQGAIEPNKLRIVEGKTLLERAEAARQLLRAGVPSGEKLVWKVDEE